jgi:parallel beta-helix repeat protein
MKRKASALAIILVILFSVVGGTPFANLASAQYYGSVGINADGTVDPADAPIQRVGDTYTLTGDVGGIGVHRSNIILDGNGHTLPGIVTSVDSLGNNVTANNAGGVFLKNVENVVVKNLIIKNCQTGIYLERCSKVTVSGNIITGTHVPVPGLQLTAGIFVWEGSGNIITENQLTDNYKGIYVGSQESIITSNNLTYSSYGIIMGSSSNHVYQNNFINNTVQAYLYEGTVNVWDNGSVGNYWSDYNGSDWNWDGIGDTPYVIDENNQDNYPLVYPWGATEVSVLSFENVLYSDSVSLNFTVSKPVRWMSYSLDGQDNVTVTGNFTLSGLATGLHNLTVYVTDVYGITGASETVTFTIEPEPFPTALVIAASGASIAIIGVGLLVYFKKRKR